MFDVQTINCMQYSEPVVIQTWSQSSNETNAHAEHLVKKRNKISFNWKEAIWSLKTVKEEKRKQGNKKEKLTESLHLTQLTVLLKKVELQHDIAFGLRIETSHKQNHCRNHMSGSKWKTYRLSAMILHSQVNLAIQFRRQGQFCCLR